MGTSCISATKMQLKYLVTLSASEADHEVGRGLLGVTGREWKLESKQKKSAGT